MTHVRAGTGPGAGTGLRHFLYSLGLLLVLLTASCGNIPPVAGTPVATLSAEPGRFTSYIVSIYQMYFTKQDGTVAYWPAYLPVINQRADLAKLSSYASVFLLSPVEEGTYESVTFVLDYTGAYITADTGNGQSQQVTAIDPATSAAAGTVTVTVKFDPDHPLVINYKKSTPVVFDIDLEASNIIGSAADGTLQTTVKPFWTATTTPVYAKPVYARGLYVVTDAKNSNFTMNVLPLHDPVMPQTPGALQTFGALQVDVDAQTYFQINGTTYVGAAGLIALSGVQNAFATVPIAAVGPTNGRPFGNLSAIKPSMSATAVYVGSSLESPAEDQLSGFVAAVNSDVLTVESAAYVDRLGNFGYAQTLPVTIGPNTLISVDDMASAAPTINSISVGQFITVLGIGTSSPYSSGIWNPTALDASGNILPGAQIRLQNSSFYGTLNSLSTGSMSVNMLAIDNIEPTSVNFAGTGRDGADAVANAYIVNTSSLDTSVIGATGAGILLKVDGSPSALQSGPPYFNASAITAASQMDAHLVLEWSGSGSATPFSSVSGSAIVVNLADTALQSGNALLYVGPVTTQNLMAQPSQNPKQLTIAYNTTNTQEPPLYGVGSVAAGEALFSEPSRFAGQVQTVVNSTSPALRLVATGQYDATTGTFSATSISINVK